jgi:hypothetical protein
MIVDNSVIAVCDYLFNLVASLNGKQDFMRDVMLHFMANCCVRTRSAS